ncbi:Vegetative incompatibility protein HET-E-1 [Grifola frondosa]|uniref:Vegetative incompatibility protein HET-E-1 n=1 Tax=Grifola frondosa TaxID=5627 RepID=A0A1C7M9V7_GRIFR|nr:Vegetative incompatibility protein HET-E-1 [Grifola frondosa]
MYHSVMVELWDSTTGRRCGGFIGYSSPIPRIYYPLDDEHSLWAESAEMWESITSFGRLAFGGHSSPLMFSSDGTLLVSGSEGCRNVSALDARMRARASLKDMAPVGTIVRLWNVSSGAGVRISEGHTGDVISVAFSFDNTQIVSGSCDHTVRVWNVATGAPLLTCVGHTGDVFADAAAGTQLRVLEGHTDPSIWSVAFSRDDSFVLSASKDATMRIWDAGSDECIHVFDRSNWLDSYVVSVDGSGIVVGPNHQVVQLWTAKNWPLRDSGEFESRSAGIGEVSNRQWPLYYKEEGWIFSWHPTRGRHRLCWVPPEWQAVKAFLGETVILDVFDDIVVLDFTALHKYLESIDTSA